MAPDVGSAAPAFTTLATRLPDGTTIRHQVARIPLREVYEYIDPASATLDAMPAAPLPTTSKPAAPANT